MESLSIVKLTLCPAKVGTGSADENAVLVHADDRIVAIFVRLDDPCHGADQGRWHLEASFGRCASMPRPALQQLEDGLRWAAGRLGISGDLNALLTAEDRELLRDGRKGATL